MTGTERQPLRVVAAVCMRGGRVLIARRRHGDSLGGKWEFPGGKIEPGESPEHALERELDEELGADFRAGRFIASRVCHYEDRSIELLAYGAALAGGEPAALDHDEICWADPKRLGEFNVSAADQFIVEWLAAGNCP